jgi:hypothetical protein
VGKLLPPTPAGEAAGRPAWNDRWFVDEPAKVVGKHQARNSQINPNQMPVVARRAASSEEHEVDSR